MKLSSSILASGLCAMILSGCGSAQSGTVTPVTVSQSRMHQASGSSGDLLYVAGACNGICIYTYPRLQYVASISGPGDGFMCTDANGHVFVTVPTRYESEGYIYEYTHGGTQPIAILNDAGAPEGCSVDPTTGNLAVANYFSPGSQFGHGDVAIYTGAQGTPTYYKNPNMYWYQFCSYDNSGNLLVDSWGGYGSPFAILPKGGSSLNQVSFNESIGAGTIVWDGQYFDVGEGYKTSGAIEQVSISGSSGTVVDKMPITGNIKWLPAYLPFALSGKKVALFFRPSGKHVGHLGFWKYPEGGNPSRVVKTLDGQKIPAFLEFGITVSVAPAPRK